MHSSRHSRRCLPAAAEVGDRPGLETNLPKEAEEEMKGADKGQVFSMGDSPWWGWDAEDEKWGWSRDPPVSQKAGGGGTGSKAARKKVGAEGEGRLAAVEGRRAYRAPFQPSGWSSSVWTWPAS